MIQMIGLKKNIGIDIREKLSINHKHIEDNIKKLKIICDEVYIISTCNRTEIYFDSEIFGDNMVVSVFEKVGWDIKFLEYVFYYYQEELVVAHLMDVVCGFDSLILGEDQILSQVKTAYEIGRKGNISKKNIGGDIGGDIGRGNNKKNQIEGRGYEKDDLSGGQIIGRGWNGGWNGDDQTTGRESSKSNKGSLCRLFQNAITCGKKFRTDACLYKIPVSSSAITVNEARKKGIKSFMVLGYGEVGRVTTKYITGGDYEKLYIAIRDTTNVNDLNIDFENRKVKVIPFKDRNKYYEDVECIISCTSAPHCVINKEDLPGKKMVIFDLAVPRDVGPGVKECENVIVFDIDEISKIDDENMEKRKKVMYEKKYIIYKYIEEFQKWSKIRDISPEISSLKKCGESVYKKRFNTFKNKMNTKDNDVLVQVLLKSTSDAYINRAIEVLKQEHIEGRGEQCMEIIKKIFYAVQ